MTTGQRLDRLERENRWMKAGGVVAMAGVVALLVVVILPARDHLVARSLTLEDTDGTASATLDSNGLEFADGNGRLTALTSSGLGGPSLVLGARGAGEPSVTLGAAFGLTFHRGPGIEAVLSHTMFALYDAKGDVIWQAPR